MPAVVRAEQAISLALDLGSTRIKIGALDRQAKLHLLDTCAAPALSGEGLIRESSATAWVTVVEALLLKHARRGLPLGISSQRSSFLLWERASGRPLTALISWQDRRALDWCSTHSHLEPLLEQLCGLRLSPHYAGPKLASLFARQPALRERAAAGEVLFGTLETWLIWNLTSAHQYVTDLTMAARTGMLDLENDDWSSELLQAYAVPGNCLPRLVASTGLSIELVNGLQLRASLADQSAGALALLPEGAVLANFGTGAFVLKAGVPAGLRQAGYLTAPLLGGSTPLYALEGTINGAGPSLDECAPAPTQLPVKDPGPGAFALPDRAGVGAPHWRPGLGPLFSADARALDPAGRRTIMLEGLLFRVREILDDLSDGEPPARILLAGGLVRDKALPLGLAALLARPVEVLEVAEAGLLGMARLAADMPAYSEIATLSIQPARQGAYLAAKFPRWQQWLQQEFSQPSSLIDSPQ